MMRRALLCGLTVVAVAGVLPAATARAAGAPSFSTPVKLTQFAQCGGYEPTVIVDRFGNIVVTAHKQNHCDGVAFDPQATPPARAASWVWTSTDGVHFTDAPGISAGSASVGASSLDVGDEGDLAKDQGGNLYFVDTKVADNSFTSWHATGPGISESFHTAAMGTAGPVDDRPWIAAHGNGVVMYIGNTGNKSAYTSPNGNGAGRYTIYMSYNGGTSGTSFDHLGITIPNSGWCRPAADPAAGSTRLYVACTDDGGHLFMYTSNDDGHTAAGWSSHPIGTYNATSAGWGANGSWPMVQVAPNGDVYVLHTDQDSGGAFHLILYRSTNHGATWSSWDATPANTGQIATNAGPAWLDIAPNGRIGMVYFSLPAGDTKWHIDAATTPAWNTPFTVVDASPARAPASKAWGTPWGDFLSGAFGPDSRFHVTWTDSAEDTQLGSFGLNSDIYYAEEALPAATVPETPAVAALAVVALGAVALVGVRRRRSGSSA